MSHEVFDLIRPRRPVRPLTLQAKSRELRIDANRSAVMVIDMQNDFIAPGGWFDARNVDGSWVKPLYPVINDTTAMARREGMPVIWLNWGVRADLLNVHPSHRRLVKPSPDDPSYAPRMATGNGPVLERGSWGAAVVPELTVSPEDIHVDKHRYTGFWDNELDSVLRNLDVTTLFVTGINVDRCVFATITDACHAGYDVVMLEDAVGTYSPQYVADATLYLVERIFGFLSDSASLAKALEKAG
ncbi:MAG TPA: isochorismatase family cysteine hydrolase [Pseudolabrys sp.]|nr:isochorismatase family cysteine hydrolase [Pseudolabrys sp.]